jgi:hypothetical protein
MVRQYQKGPIEIGSGDLDCIKVAQNKVQSRAVVNAVMNVRSPTKNVESVDKLRDCRRFKEGCTPWIQEKRLTVIYPCI